MLQGYVGEQLTLKVLEADPDTRRLILSERLARRRLRKQNIQRLLHTLVEGSTCRGTVSTLCNFGAFVDLGGADGLIHISELAWSRVRHPEEIVAVGDEIEVLVLRLDRERERIGLSLKRLQPNPWEVVDEEYSVGQLVGGRVTTVVDFGAFIALPIGVQGLVHVTELADPPPPDPGEFVQPGEELVLRILDIEPRRERVRLSLRRVSAEEREEWFEELEQDQATQEGDDNIYLGVNMTPEPSERSRDGGLPDDGVTRPCVAETDELRMGEVTGDISERTV
jgi:small subunit ribosomal protein S1